MESAIIPSREPSGSILYAPVPPSGGHGERDGGVRHQPNKYPVSTLLSNYCTNSKIPVRSIFMTEKADIYGCKDSKTNNDCGTHYGIIACSKDPVHSSSVKHICCNDPLCPVCYPKYTHKLAKGVIERILGYSKVYPDDPFNHLIISPPQGTRYQDLKRAFKAVGKVFLDYGGKAGVFWLHWYRIRPEVKERLWVARELWKQDHPYNKHPPGFWKLAHQNILKLQSLGDYLVYSPHFHGITTGYMIKSDEFCELTDGWIYKKVAKDEGEDLPESSTYQLTPEDLSRVAHYLSTHCAYEWTKHAVRYFGDISYSRLGRKDKHTERVQQTCPKCGAPLVEHLVNQVTGELGDCTGQEVTEKMISWTYYKRIPKERPKGMRTKGPSQVNRATESRKDGT